MSWTDPLDAYCERTSAAFWAEPLNAVSNAAFIAAAFLAFLAWRQTAAKDRASLALILLVVVIGIGSFLFHTIAERWSSLADVIPIAAFIYAYFGFALRRFLGLSLPLAAVGTLAFLAASFVAGPLLAPVFGSSASYVPALLAMLGVGGWLAARRHPAGAALLTAGALFAVSLACRMADLPLCPEWPFGTHFLWHVFNAATLWCLLAAAVRHGEGVTPSSSGRAL